ncbi:hypothetical protein CKAN_02056600 [Cinnamomum micranthum f. kanehirae]|uniref:Uncharacterized protein n=1 Tax=Cinnamomum micranthum f. kanehirae TaxID=337451 RepID=A0A443PKW5_9MAGN|nr:hypothetical protein CKAN_02056600 [Cinnamomum micranthum f. kanehirae]
MNSTLSYYTRIFAITRKCCNKPNTCETFHVIHLYCRSHVVGECKKPKLPPRKHRLYLSQCPPLLLSRPTNQHHLCCHLLSSSPALSSSSFPFFQISMHLSLSLSLSHTHTHTRKPS